MSKKEPPVIDCDLIREERENANIVAKSASIRCYAWIPMSEKRPQEDVGVLVTDGKVVTAVKLEYEDENVIVNGHEYGGWEFDFFFDVKKITHWMPCPPPPIE